MTNKLFILSLFLMFANLNLSSQTSIDTIQIKEFSIFGKKINKEENSGMTITSVDSIVLLNKTSSSLSSLLSENTSVYINSYANGSLATASFRGTASTHTQVQWNGMNLNSPMLGMVDFSQIPVYLIDELTLYHGNASLSQASGGLGGAISLNNKADWQNKLRLQYSQGIGSFHSDNEYLKIETGNSKFQSKTRLYRTQSKNDFSFINMTIGSLDTVTNTITHPLDTNNNSAYNIYGLLQEFYTKLNSKNLLSVYYWGQKIKRNIPRITSYEGNSPSCRNQQTDYNHKIIFSFDHAVSQGNISIKEGFEYGNLLYVLENMVANTNPFPVVYSKSNFKRWLQNFNLNKSFSRIFNYDLNISHTFQSVETIDTINNTGYNIDRNEITICNSLIIKPIEQISINGLIRSELNGEKFIPIIPYLGINYQPIKEKNFYIKANISRNYHFPTLNDLYWQPGGNPDLRPENGFGWEISANYDIKNDNFKFSPQIAYYSSKINDWIIWLPSARGYWEPLNIEKVNTSGIEIGINSSKKIHNWIFAAILNYSFGKSINLGNKNVWGAESYNDQLPFIPQHSGNALISAKWKYFRLDYQYNSFSKRYITNSSAIGTRQAIYPYFMNNVSTAYEQSFKNFTIELEIKIYNLFNETYHSALLQPMPKRNYMFLSTIKYQLQ